MANQTRVSYFLIAISIRSVFIYTRNWNEIFPYLLVFSTPHIFLGICLGCHRDWKRTAWSLIYFLIYAYFNILAQSLDRKMVQSESKITKSSSGCWAVNLNILNWFFYFLLVVASLLNKSVSARQRGTFTGFASWREKSKWGSPNIFTLMPGPCSGKKFNINFGNRSYSKEKRPGFPLLFWI